MNNSKRSVYYRNLADAITGLTKRECSSVYATWRNDVAFTWRSSMRIEFSISNDGELCGYVTAIDDDGTMIQSGHHANFRTGLPLDLSYIGVP